MTRRNKLGFGAGIIGMGKSGGRKSNLPLSSKAKIIRTSSRRATMANLREATMQQGFERRKTAAKKLSK